MKNYKLITDKVLNDLFISLYILYRFILYCIVLHYILTSLESQVLFKVPISPYFQYPNILVVLRKSLSRLELHFDM